MILKEANTIFGRAGAAFSECGLYRYRLWRSWDVGPWVNYIMLNPSTADHRANDPTITRCMRRAREMEFGGMVVTNLFAFRATDPAAMKACAAPIGPDNDAELLAAARRAHSVVCAWGNLGAHMGRSRDVYNLLRGLGPSPHDEYDLQRPYHKLYALRVNGLTGEPSHPLYLPMDLPLRPYRRKCA